MDKVEVTRQLDKYTLNPLLNALAKLNLTIPGVVILETRGRKTGKRRRVPVGGKVEGDTVWIVAEHGRRTGYIRNIEADPQVRVLVAREWRSGTARLLPRDDPRERIKKMTEGTLALRLVEAVTLALMTTPMTVRIDLDKGAANPSWHER